MTPERVVTVFAVLGQQVVTLFVLCSGGGGWLRVLRETPAGHYILGTKLLR
jgi:hypothetical protein